MLFSRYGQGNTVLNMNFIDAIELINHANRQKTEEILLNRWITNYEKEMSLQEFKQKLGINDSNEEVKQVKEILLELKEVFG